MRTVVNLQAKNGLLGNSSNTDSRGKGNIGNATKNVKWQWKSPIDWIRFWVQESKKRCDQRDGDPGQCGQAEPWVKRVKVRYVQPSMWKICGEKANPRDHNHARLNGKVNSFLNLIANCSGRSVYENSCTKSDVTNWLNANSLQSKRNTYHWHWERSC